MGAEVHDAGTAGAAWSVAGADVVSRARSVELDAVLRPWAGRCPDENTLWDFRETMIAAGTFGKQFNRLNAAIE